MNLSIKYVFVLAAFISCLFFSLNGTEKTVKLQLRWKHQFQFAGYYMAKEQGYYKNKGLDVEIIEGGPYTDILKEVESGNAAYGVQTPSILIDRAKGSPVIVLAAIFQHSPVALLVDKKSGIEYISQLAGKKIMLGLKNVEIRAMLLNEGLLDRIEISEFTGDYNDVVNGNVAGSSGYITDLTYVESQDENTFNYIRPVTYGVDFYGDCLFTTESNLHDNNTEIEGFIEASLEGWHYAMRNPELTAQTIIKKYNHELKKDDLLFEHRQMMKLILPDLVDIGQMSSGRWKHILEIFQRTGMIEKDFNLKGFLYTEHKAESNLLKNILIFLTFLFFTGLLVIYSKFRKERKKELAEEARHKEELKRSEARFRGLIEFAVDGIFIGDQNGIIIEVNEMACSIIGMKKEELVGKFVNVVPFTRQSIEKEPLRFDLLKEGKILSRERDILRPDGRILNIEMKTRLMSDGTYQSIFRDVTEKKKREELLKIFREAVENSRDGIGMSTPDGKHYYQNSSLTKMLGEFGDDPLNAYCDRELGKKIFETIESGKHWAGDVEMFNSAKEVITVRLNAYPVSDDSGKISSLVGIHTDITEVRKKENELAELKTRFEYVLGATNTGFDLIDEDFYVQYTDPDWTLRLGDYRSKKCYEYFMGRSSSCPNCGIPMALKTGRTVITEEYLEKENRYIEVHTIPFASAENKKRIVAEFNIDITERKNKEIELKKEITEKETAHREIRQLLDTLEIKVKERTKDLEYANKELESFSYSVSHDLRAPVRHIAGFTDMIKKELAENKPDPGKIRDYLNKVISSSAKMESMIDSILKFSRTSRHALIKERADMNRIVKEAVNEVLHGKFHDKINWKIPELPNVYADRNLILSVWINLIDNALKFTKNQEKPVIEIGYNNISEGHEFYIRDNGAGFDMEYSHKLFGVFQRLHLEKDYPGTGIGLANVRRIIEKHGGSIRAESDGKTGAVFYFILPAEGGIS